MNPLTIIIEAGLMLLILLSPYAFASVPLWAYTIIELAVLTLVLVWVIKMIREGELSFPSSSLNIFIALFLGLVIFQLIPLPGSLLAIISPGTSRFYMETSSSIESAQSLGLSPTISLNAYASKGEFWRMLAYLGAFFLILGNIISLKQVKRLIVFIIVAGFVLALFALIQRLTWNGKVFWFYVYPEGGSPFGPFINKNNYAGYINMIIPLALTFSIYAKDKGVKFLFAFMALLMVVTVMLSMSRGGVFSFIAGISFMAGMLFYVKRGSGYRIPLLIAGIFFLSITLYLALIGLDPVVDRLSTLASLETYRSDMRWPVWASTMEIIKDYPLFGSGFGTFESVFPLHRPIDLYYLHWRDAHNDYLQLLSDTGIVGFLIVASFFALLFKRAFISFKSKRDERQDILILGLICSVVVFLFSILFTFNTHIPASALLFSVICAVLVKLTILKGVDSEFEES